NVVGTHPRPTPPREEDDVRPASLGSADHTNAEPKSPVVLVHESGEGELNRERETCGDVFGDDRIPEELKG
ncbi:hypothetical protein BRD15_07495, partial [Halobacteriales archaeon SW_6_65_15]